MNGILVAILLLGADLPSMRCGDLLVLPGENKLEVLSRCGEPHLRERISGSDAASEEVWIYDWPERNAQKLLRFEGVTLVNVQDAGRLPDRSGGGTLRCDGRLMQAGITKVTVRKLCGEPDLIEKVSGEEQPSREVWVYEQDNATAELRFTGVRLDRIDRRRR